MIIEKRKQSKIHFLPKVNTRVIPGSNADCVRTKYRYISFKQGEKGRICSHENFDNSLYTICLSFLPLG